MTLPTYILSLDQGTTSSRAILFNKEGNIVSIAQKEFKQIYPQPGWVEHDAREIYSTQVTVATEAVLKAHITAESIAAIGITNQRETTVVWDKQTGIPIYNAIVWQDRRTAAYCNSLKQQGIDQTIQEKTGLIVDAYFSATKVKWILDEVPGARKKAEEGQLLFGTIDTWLIWNLTGGKVHVTDVTNASRTMIYNINTLAWDDELLSLFNIPKAMLPKVSFQQRGCGRNIRKNICNKNSNSRHCRRSAGSPIWTDVYQAGHGKKYLRYRLFYVDEHRNQAKLSKHKLVTTIAWKIGDEVHYALEGSIFIGGAVVQWLRDGLGIIQDFA